MKNHTRYFLILILILGMNLNSYKSFAEEVIPVEGGSVSDAKPTNAEEKAVAEPKAEAELIEISPIVWNENLKLKDYVLTASTIYTKENMTLEEYRKNTEKLYTTDGKGDVFSVAIEYGLLLIDLGELDKADAVFTRGIKDFKGNPTPVVYKAWVDALKGNYKAAKDAWYGHINEKVATSRQETLWLPYDVDSLVGLNLIKDNLSDADKEDIKKLDKTVGKLSGNSKLSSLLINEDFKNGRLKNAANRIGVCLAKDPSDPVAVTLLGISQLIIGKNEEALKMFEQANSIYEYSPTTNLMKARALFALDKKKD